MVFMFFCKIHLSSSRKKKDIILKSCWRFPLWSLLDSVYTLFAGDKMPDTNLLQNSELPTTLKSHATHVFSWPFKYPLLRKELLPWAKQVPFLFQVSSKLILMKFWWYLKTIHWFNIDLFDCHTPGYVLEDADYCNVYKTHLIHTPHKHKSLSYYIF